MDKLEVVRWWLKKTGWVVGKYIIDEDEQEEFGLWAFGEGYRKLDSCNEFMHTWNMIHGDELLLKPGDCPDEDIPIMIKVWMQHRGEAFHEC